MIHYRSPKGVPILLALIGFSIAASVCGPCFALAGDPPPRRVVLACQEGGDFARASLDLATAELGRDAGLALLERAALEKVLAEQKLTLASLTSPAESLRVGVLLKADLIVVVAGLKPGEPGAVTAFDVRGGRRLLDRELPAAAAPDAAAGALALACREAATKEGNTAGLKTVSVLPVHNVDLSPLELSAARALLTLAGRRLVQSGNVALLEREHLGLFEREQGLPGGNAEALTVAAASWQVVPAAQRVPEGSSLRLDLSAPGGASGSLQVLVRSGNALAGLADELSREVLRVLAEAPAGASPPPAREAQVFLARARSLAAMARFQEALQAMDAAVVLDPTGAMYTAREKMARSVFDVVRPENSIDKVDLLMRTFEALHAYWQAGTPYPSGIEALRSGFDLPKIRPGSNLIPPHLSGRLEGLYAEHARLSQAYLDRMFIATSAKPDQASILELGVAVHEVTWLVTNWLDFKHLLIVDAKRSWPELRLTQGLKWLELLAWTPIAEDAYSASPAHDGPNPVAARGLDHLLNLQARLLEDAYSSLRHTPDLPLPTPDQRALRRRQVAALRALPVPVGRHYATMAEINDTWVDARGGAQLTCNFQQTKTSFDVDPATRTAIDARIAALHGEILQDIVRLEASGNASAGAVRSLYFSAVNANYFRADATYGAALVGLWQFMRDRGKVEPATLAFLITSQGVPDREAFLTDIRSSWDAGRLSFHGNPAPTRAVLEKELGRFPAAAPATPVAVPWTGTTAVKLPPGLGVSALFGDQLFGLTSSGNSCARISLADGTTRAYQLGKTWRNIGGITSLRAGDRLVAIWGDVGGLEILDLRSGATVFLDAVHGLPYEDVRGVAVVGPTVYFFLRGAHFYTYGERAQDFDPFYLCRYDLDRRALETLATNTRPEPATPLDAVKKLPSTASNNANDMYAMVLDRRRNRLVFHFPDKAAPQQLWEYRLADGVLARLPVVLPTDRWKLLGLLPLNDRFLLFNQRSVVGLFDLATDTSRLLVLDHDQQLPPGIPAAGVVRRKAQASDKGRPCYGIFPVGDMLWCSDPSLGRLRDDGTVEPFPGDIKAFVSAILDARTVLLRSDNALLKLHLRDPLRLLPDGPPAPDEALPGAAVP